MSDERWTIVDRVLDGALAREPHERAAFLGEACGNDEALRREVESLLVHEREAAGFMSTPAGALADGNMSSGTSMIGRQLGPYAIQAPLGAGGMGEVYRARDTKLGRDVAIKILPRLFMTDPERRARFEREARLLASLNHPHIGAIYGLEDMDGAAALILELVEGATLAERIARGPLPIGETLDIARQMAYALEAAHEKGIVHRDLKPSNIKITPDGVVKVLDFGLAKAVSGDPSGPDLTQSPTLTMDGTRDGVILGTVAYMSPEQARGKPLDKRTDIWAFGCVLDEMLTGRAVFRRETVSDTLAAILEGEPNWQALPVATPGKVRDLLRRCLQKDPQRRLRDIGDARLDIDDAIAAPLGTDRSAAAVRRGSAVAWVVAGAILGSLMSAGLLLLFRHQPAVPTPDLTLTIAPPSASGIQPVESGLARPEISPDGSFVAYHDRSGTLQLRRLNGIASEPLRAIRGVLAKVWSPDSKSLLFADNTSLKRMRVPDGAPEIIGRLPGPFAAASVSDGGALLFLCCPTGEVGLFVVTQAGAEAQEIRVPGLKEGTYVTVSFLPDGEDFLIGFVPQGSEENELYLVTLRDGKPADPVLLMRNAIEPKYTPAGGGRVLFVRNDNLYAQTLNRRTRRLEDEPDLVQQGVASRAPSAHFSASHSGIVVWRPGRAVVAQVTIFDRQGKPVGTAGPPMSEAGSLKLSPDEQRMLVATRNGRAWLVEPNQNGRFELGQSHLNMLWSPNASSVLVPQESRIIQRPLSGSSDARDLARVSGLARLEDVSSDGKVFLFRNGTFASNLFFVRLDGTAKEPVPITVQTGEPVSNVGLSPDEHWIVYQVAGLQQQAGVYVQAFPGPALPKQIASTGESPVWRKDGREILYLDRDRIWSVRVDTSGGEFRKGLPEPLFAVRSLEGGRRVNGVSQLAVSRDGSRIYYQQPVEQPDSDVIHVRMGWEGAAGR